MVKKYKCKICGYKFKVPEIEKEEVFKTPCPKCEGKGVVRNNTIVGDIICLLIAIGIFVWFLWNYVLN